MNESVDLSKFEGKMFDDFTKNIRPEPTQRSSRPQRIPVIMISGFLGSGKTTLMNYILRHHPEMKIGAIVNDFGKINIDNKLLAGNVSEKTIELSNGCICCIMGDNGLTEPLDLLANEESQLDAILIEASGIAEPYELMQTLRFSGNKYTYFGGNVYMIDAQNFGLAEEQFPSHFKKCIKTADILVLNKVDLVDECNIQKIDEKIRLLNHRSPILHTERSEIDTNLLFAFAKDTSLNYDENNVSIKQLHSHHHHKHIHEQFNTVSFSSSEPLDPLKFINFLDNLPENLFRMKGFCYFGLKGYEQKYLLQIVGRNIEISAQTWQENEPLASELVLIGINLDKNRITDRLNSLIDANPEDIQPENMMNFERFFQRS